MGRLIAVCKRFHPFHITSKQPSWRITSTFRHSTEEIIDANSIYKVKTFMVINYWILIDYLLCSTQIFWRCPPRCDFRRWLQRWLLNFSCPYWSRWTTYLAIVTYHMSLQIILQKEVSKGNWKLFVRYSFQSPIGIILLMDHF